MAGHIAGLGYSQRMDANGNPLAGCKLYIYETGTSTPASVYEDYALSIAHAHPIVADSAGIIPMFWVADGTYRARLQDASGNEIFDDDGIVALGPSSGSGSSSSVDSDAIFATGDILWQPINGTRTGWVRANGRTIGSAASGAIERANADVEALFLFLWTNYSNTLCPVSGGRGASAAADWAANKTIGTLDMRGRTGFGLDNMGNSNAGILSGSTAIATIGAATTTLTVAQLPSHTHGSGTLAGSTHVHSVTDLELANNILAVVTTASTMFFAAGTGAVDGVPKGVRLFSTLDFSDDVNASTVEITGNTGSTGSGSSFNFTNPGMLGTWFLRL